MDKPTCRNHIKPYFEAVRIATDENTKQEFEYPVMFLWQDVSRIELGVDDGSFANKALKSVVFTGDGNMWLLTPYKEISAAWAAWVDDISAIQSVFRPN